MRWFVFLSAVDLIYFNSLVRCVIRLTHDGKLCTHIRLLEKMVQHKAKHTFLSAVKEEQRATTSYDLQ